MAAVFLGAILGVRKGPPGGTRPDRIMILGGFPPGPTAVWAAQFLELQLVVLSLKGEELVEPGLLLAPGQVGGHEVPELEGKDH